MRVENRGKKLEMVIAPVIPPRFLGAKKGEGRRSDFRQGRGIPIRIKYYFNDLETRLKNYKNMVFVNH